MKPSLVLRVLLLVMLTLSQNAECRPIKGKRSWDCKLYIKYNTELL